jgi:hypothetical protein
MGGRVMTMNAAIIIGLIVIALSIVFGIVWDSYRSGRAFCTPLPLPYRHRESQEQVWRHRYPNSRYDTADAVLRMVCGAFAFNPDDRCQLAPDDRIMDIYQCLYPPRKFWPVADSLEVESLGMILQRKFGFSPSQWHKDITIGEIVDWVLAARNDEIGALSP